MSEFKPGDVAMVTIYGHEHVAFLTLAGWVNASSSRCGDLADATDARRLVVVDPESLDDARRLNELLVRHGSGNGMVLTLTQQALREFANPTPPKPDEPTGLGAVVECHGRRWVYTGDSDYGGQWWFSKAEISRWREFDSVTILTEGVQL